MGSGGGGGLQRSEGHQHDHVVEEWPGVSCHHPLPQTRSPVSLSSATCVRIYIDPQCTLEVSNIYTYGRINVATAHCGHINVLEPGSKPWPLEHGYRHCEVRPSHWSLCISPGHLSMDIRPIDIVRSGL